MTIATKKAVAKKVVKKAVTSKKVTGRVAPKKVSNEKVLVYADNERSFWTHDGQVLNNLVALHETLSAMDKAIYSYHVTKDAHHFADWVEIVLMDAPCASDLRKAKTPATAKLAVAKHLKTYLV